MSDGEENEDVEIPKEDPLVSLQYNYATEESLQYEISEFFSLSETVELLDCRSTFRSIYGHGKWTLASEAGRREFATVALQQQDNARSYSRQWYREILLFLAQGVPDEVDSPETQIRVAKMNCVLMKDCGILGAVIPAFLMTLHRHNQHVDDIRAARAAAAQSATGASLNTPRGDEKTTAADGDDGMPALTAPTKIAGLSEPSPLPSDLVAHEGFWQTLCELRQYLSVLFLLLLHNREDRKFVDIFAGTSLQYDDRFSGSASVSSGSTLSPSSASSSANAGSNENSVSRHDDSKRKKLAVHKVIRANDVPSTPIKPKDGDDASAGSDGGSGGDSLEPPVTRHRAISAPYGALSAAKAVRRGGDGRTAERQAAQALAKRNSASGQPGGGRAVSKTLITLLFELLGSERAEFYPLLKLSSLVRLLLTCLFGPVKSRLETDIEAAVGRCGPKAVVQPGQVPQDDRQRVALMYQAQPIKARPIMLESTVQQISSAMVPLFLDDQRNAQADSQHTRRIRGSLAPPRVVNTPLEHAIPEAKQLFSSLHDVPRPAAEALWILSACSYESPVGAATSKAATVTKSRESVMTPSAAEALYARLVPNGGFEALIGGLLRLLAAASSPAAAPVEGLPDLRLELLVVPAVAAAAVAAERERQKEFDKEREKERFRAHLARTRADVKSTDGFAADGSDPALGGGGGALSPRKPGIGAAGGPPPLMRKGSVAMLFVMNTSPAPDAVDGGSGNKSAAESGDHAAPGPDGQHPGSGTVDESKMPAVPLVAATPLDLRRQQERVLKSVTAIMLRLLKTFRSSHVLQYQHICAVLQQLNAPVVLLKVLNQDVLQSCNKSSDVPDLSIFSRTIWTLDMRRLLKALGAATVTLNTVSPRKCCAYINALRVLHKVTKHSPPHLRMLVRFRAHEILRPLAGTVSHVEMQLYALKVFKSITRYTPMKWRSTHRVMRVITRVFHCTRMEVADYWADDEDIKDSRHAPQHAEDLKALEALRDRVRKYNLSYSPKRERTGFVQLHTGEVEMDPFAETERMVHQTVLPPSVKRHYRQFVEQLLPNSTPNTAAVAGLTEAGPPARGVFSGVRARQLWSPHVVMAPEALRELVLLMGHTGYPLAAGLPGAHSLPASAVLEALDVFSD